MINLTGQNFIGNHKSAEGKSVFHAVDPSNGEQLPTDFIEATQDEIDKAIVKADAAFMIYRKKSGEEKAVFLETIAEEILALGDDLIKRCCAESGLPEGRITGERGRTMNQLKLFASVVREGSWVDARIDTADPIREPIPKPDVRSMQQSLGAVGVFGASNFPLAFSVAGGDTASALAAGCPVVFKGHPAHPGTCEMIATAIINAVKKTEMPEGTFSLVQGPSVEVGMKIVNHPLIKAIGFTGSYRGGKAIFDAANARPEPIPVYAEMGSTNPVFILPGILAERKAAIASGLSASVTLGVGQFCTNPGLIISEKSKESAEFIAAVADGIKNSAASSMLTAGIHNAYNQGVKKLSDSEGVEVIAKGGESDEGFKGTPYMMQLDANKFMSNKALEEEVFGPSTLAVNADDKEDILTIAENLGGHLTATIFATEEELSNYTDLIAILERKVGRLIINAFPTGVEVCHAMIHGGPFPATSNSMTTSVGTSAIRRFSRPVCYQNLQDDLLPDELRNSNPLGIMRLFDGELKR